MMKKYIYIWTTLIAVSLLSGSALAQNRKEKLTKSYNVTKDVVLDVDTRYVDVIFETWNKNKIQIEAFVEAENANDAVNNWDLGISGNTNRIQISSKDGYSKSKVYDLEDIGDLNINLDLEEIIGQSLTIVEPIMSGLVGPLLEGISGTKLPDDFYEEMSKMKFDHEAYEREGKAYLKRWEKEMDKSFGPEFDKKMEKWENEVERKSEDWSERLIEKSGIPRWPFNSGGNITFDSDEYERNKQAYVSKLNKRYNTNVSVREVEQWLEEVEEWGEEFEHKMEAWGENFGKSMEKWGEEFGENFGESMEKWGESFGKNMEAWGENFGKSMEKWAKENEGNWEEHHSEDEHGNKSSGFSMSWDSDKQEASKKSHRSVKRIIKIKMPKDTELDLNVRYGKVKIADAYNAKATISHGSLAAINIEGENTTLDISYSPVRIENWKGGSLKTSHVSECTIREANNISINSNSSNVTVNTLNGSGMISGSFGKLSIPRVTDSFGSLTIILENSDLALKLPEEAFNFSYSGDHNDFILPNKLQTKSLKNGKTEMVNGFHKTRSTGNLITITAKYSDVILQ
ncbi:hypothetical protein [Dokdonia sp. Hel_I_53]|uniref:hypothetical protein n=1 Tax=Dokdonia sp. Hel_I_53 TaxID=1566287 RepID=UPI001199EDF3|nr:hypothetical protein [Dokdonia sp. Hel_I_53]TVZ51861.1 hypothetical protein OD90_1020 [Dokdonia sp. Hel_I_53]